MQQSHFHIIFRDSLDSAKIGEFLSKLPTQITDDMSRPKPCSELVGTEFQTATVSRADIKDAFRKTFGEKAEPSDYLVYLAPANNNGVRAETGQQRKANIADEIDKDVHAIFGKDPSNSDYFLRTDRYEDKSISSKPKPVFGGCDAHNFENLENWLGKSVVGNGTRQVVTWVKADPTFEGLQQTLVEPSERVSLHPNEPDQKEPYRVISRVSFSGTTEFPTQVLLNRNLNAIIGSRSSGKSSLLAHIAHAVDPDETARLQAEAHGLGDPREAGPAAGYTWDEVSGVKCDVEWASGGETVGKVIYIPQNSLYSLSEQPEEITKKIAPALFRAYPSVKTSYDSTLANVASLNAAIKVSIDEWFSLTDRIEDLTAEIRDLGDKSAIEAERNRLQSEIDKIKAAASLTDDEVSAYQAVAGSLEGMANRFQEIQVELDQLAYYVNQDETEFASRPQTVQATISLRPSGAELPDLVAVRLEELKTSAVAMLVDEVEAALLSAATDRFAERASLREQIQVTRQTHEELIAKHEANEELATVVADHKKQLVKLEDIAKREASRANLQGDRSTAGNALIDRISDRSTAVGELVSVFEADTRVLTDLTFGIETEVPEEAVAHATVGLSQRSTNEYVKSKGDLVAYRDAQADPTKFLEAIRTGLVTLNKGYQANAVASDVLTVSEEVRFSAVLDSDRIGGFTKSSMTPGKQALFALTLILNESQEPWPLLIDQPEDDLDSRSIYDTIVPYLVGRKKERQIIMVSHNANLVIGADSELVIVANRHGDDRKNKNGRTFEYFTGSLEHSQPLNESSATALGRFGVREHACEILDGGEVAFQKRRNKYKI